MLLWIGARLVGSKAKYSHYRAIVTWSMFPLIILALIWWVPFLAKGAELFINMDNADSLPNGQIVADINGWWTSFTVMQGGVSKFAMGFLFLLAMWKLWIVALAIEVMEKWSRKKSVAVAFVAFLVFALFVTKAGYFNVTFKQN